MTHVLVDTAGRPEAKVLASFTGGIPALVEAPLGRGRVLLLTTTIDRDWADLALRTSFPPLAQRMKKEATVLVKVLVDENGRVVDAQINGAKVGYGLDEAAVDYARSCGYAAPTKNGVSVRMWTDLKVAFTLGGG